MEWTTPTWSVDRKNIIYYSCIYYENSIQKRVMGKTLTPQMPLGISSKHWGQWNVQQAVWTKLRIHTKFKKLLLPLGGVGPLCAAAGGHLPSTNILIFNAICRILWNLVQGFWRYLIFKSTIQWNAPNNRFVFREVRTMGRTMSSTTLASFYSITPI